MCTEDALARACLALAALPLARQPTKRGAGGLDPEDLLSAGRSGRQATSKPFRLPASVTPGCFIIVTCMWRRRGRAGSAWTWFPVTVVSFLTAHFRFANGGLEIPRTQFPPEFHARRRDHRALVWATRGPPVPDASPQMTASSHHTHRSGAWGQGRRIQYRLIRWDGDRKGGTKGIWCLCHGTMAKDLPQRVLRGCKQIHNSRPSGWPPAPDDSTLSRSDCAGPRNDDLGVIPQSFLFWLHSDTWAWPRFGACTEPTICTVPSFSPSGRAFACLPGRDLRSAGAHDGGG